MSRPSHSYFEDILRPIYARSDAQHLIPDSEGRAVVDKINAICKRDNKYFCDLGFPAVKASINGIPKDEAYGYIEGEFVWKRIIHMYKDACLFAGKHGQFGVSLTDVNQGGVGNCWMCAQLSAIATYPAYIYHCFYPGKEYMGKINPHGVYAMRIHRRGKWYWVLVDDWLPLFADRVAEGTKALASITSKTENEFWTIIMEKVFAKLSGSWQQTWAGMSLSFEPIHNVTGRPLYIYCDSEKPDRLFHWTKRLFAAGCFMACSTDNTREGDGLVQGHAYTVLGVYEHPGSGAKLYKLRNPWGQGGEWAGAWGDASDEWKQYPDALRATGHVLSDAYNTDGIFYIGHLDFARIFCGIRAFPHVEANWPPSEPGVPSSLKEPMSLDYCYGDDLKKHKGSEGYQTISRLVASHPPLVDNDADYILAHQTPQYLMKVTKTMPVRFSVSRVDEASMGGYPSMILFTLDEDALGSNPDVSTLRRLDTFSASHPSTLEGEFHRTSFESWSDEVIPKGIYLMTCYKVAHGGKNLNVVFKASRPIEFIPIPLGGGDTVHGIIPAYESSGSWTDEIDVMPQYILSMEEEGSEVSFMLDLPSLDIWSRMGAYMLCYRLEDDDMPGEKLSGEELSDSHKMMFNMGGVGNNHRHTEYLSPGNYALCIMGVNFEGTFGLSYSLPTVSAFEAATFYELE
eukprot:gnl/Dysnectes_brevis/4555_a6173_453.p1 GENE.gnl/Dysnectes_brevis/4555_a6173_453~~gnl/Dysnectes_brevis/4555_a6173_453.p1  ORF type:complete len:683 (-),score=209.14 gnl/Dysnectes_brevis/4555_a6173_453:105-2153(-)